MTQRSLDLRAALHPTACSARSRASTLALTPLMAALPPAGTRACPSSAPTAPCPSPRTRSQVPAVALAMLQRAAVRWPVVVMTALVRAAAAHCSYAFLSRFRQAHQA